MSGTQIKWFIEHEGSDAYMLAGTVLYYMCGNERPYELVLDEDTTDASTGRFVFTNSKTAEMGVLTLTKGGCTVNTTFTGRDVVYYVSPMPSNCAPPQRLSEFDFRQKPALLLRVRGTDTVVYLSRRAYRGQGEWYRFDRLFVVTMVDGTASVAEYGNVRDVSYRSSPVRSYEVDRSAHPLSLWPTNVLDTGSWDELGTDAVLEALPLDRYRIHHNQAGDLVYFGVLG